MHALVLYDLTGKPMEPRQVKAVQYVDGAGILFWLPGSAAAADGFYPYHRIHEILTIPKVQEHA
jgi:hypothetical protein